MLINNFLQGKIRNAFMPEFLQKLTLTAAVQPYIAFDLPDKKNNAFSNKKFVSLFAEFLNHSS